MTIGVFILNPQNEFEKNFYIPIATESFFNECWLPAIESIGLQWSELFSIGVDIEKENVADIIEELIQIKEWARKNVHEEHQNKLFERIKILQEKLPQAFRRKDAVVFIG
ncbi:hypothetical protein J6TS2_37800 [Heyndrickxia sporothermodurans]|nr:hypothetical protein J6TS2_37800 [Heyndrickxia sporothermodurans]